MIERITLTVGLTMNGTEGPTIPEAEALAFLLARMTAEGLAYGSAVRGLGVYQGETEGSLALSVIAEGAEPIGATWTKMERIGSAYCRAFAQESAMVTAEPIARWAFPEA